MKLSYTKAMRRRSVLANGALALGALMLGTAALAQNYPDRPVKIVLGYAPGGTADFFARVVAQRLTGELPQPFVIENKPGASGMIATGQVARSPADGYTLLFGNTAEMAVNHHLTQNAGLNPEKDLVPVAAINDVPLVMVVGANSPYKTFADVIDAGKRPDANISFASAGAGSPGHIAGVELARRAGIIATHVPYKGASPALVDVIAGRVTFYFAGLTSVTQYVTSGAVRILAISSQKRSTLAKDTPTVGELIGGEFVFTLWGGLFAPAKTPPAVVQTLNKKVNEILLTPQVAAQFAREGSEAKTSTPDEFGAFVRKESATYQRIINAADIKSD